MCIRDSIEATTKEMLAELVDEDSELIDVYKRQFKIEGRMKQPSYVAAVTGMYRKYVDLYLREGRKAYKVTEKDKQELLAAYQRLSLIHISISQVVQAILELCR